MVGEGQIPSFFAKDDFYGMNDQRVEPAATGYCRAWQKKRWLFLNLRTQFTCLTLNNYGILAIYYLARGQTHYTKELCLGPTAFVVAVEFAAPPRSCAKNARTSTSLFGAIWAVVLRAVEILESAPNLSAPQNSQMLNRSKRRAV